MFNTTIICGTNHSLSLDDEGDVWIFGKNESQMISSVKKNSIILPPKKIQSLHSIKSIACGYKHIICCDYAGKVYSFGDNEFGQLGLNHSYSTKSPLPQVVDIPPIERVYCGKYFTICLNNKGCVWSFGRGDSGQLGLGNFSNSSSPKLIPDLKDVNLLDCGDDFVICKTNNKLLSWGFGLDGQLGNGLKENHNTPTSVLNYPENIISIKCGLLHTLLLTLEGKVFSFGFGLYGQLGVPEQKNNILLSPTYIPDLPFIRKIEAGFEHSMCVDLNNDLWVFGQNQDGQLGIGYITKVDKPKLNSNINNVIDISHGGFHTFIKTSDGKIYSCGANTKQQQGKKTKHSSSFKFSDSLENMNIWQTILPTSRQKSARN